MYIQSYPIRRRLATGAVVLGALGSTTGCNPGSHKTSPELSAKPMVAVSAPPKVQPTASPSVVSKPSYEGIHSLESKARQTAFKIASVALLSGPKYQPFGNKFVGNQAPKANNFTDGSPDILLSYSPDSSEVSARIVKVVGLKACNSVSLKFSIAPETEEVLDYILDSDGRLIAKDFTSLFATPATTLSEVSVLNCGDNNTRLSGNLKGETLTFHADGDHSAFTDTQDGLKANAYAQDLTSALITAEQDLRLR